MRVYRDMGEQAHKALAEDDVPEDERLLDCFLDLRYVGQEYYLTVPIDASVLTVGDGAAILAAFDDQHAHQYGHKGTNEAVEIVNLRLSGRGLRRKIEATPPAGTGSGGSKRRPVWFDASAAREDCQVFQRGDLNIGARVEGPAIIEESATTIVLRDGDRAVIDPTGAIVIDIGTDATRVRDQSLNTLTESML